MRKYLENYREEYKQNLLDILWKQWNSIGVSGYGDKWKNSAIDPEALLLISCTIARYDPRLFDGIIEWVIEYENIINIQRLKRIQKIKKFSNINVLGAISQKVKNSVNNSKWNKSTKFIGIESTEPRELFFLTDNKPLPVMGELDQTFEKYNLLRNKFIKPGIVTDSLNEDNENLLLKLRSFFGLNARSEIILYLIINKLGSPREIARECYYSHATIIKTLNEMSKSLFIVYDYEGRKKYYSFNSEKWSDLLAPNNLRLKWINWGDFFKFFELFWTFLFREDINSLNDEQISSVLRRILLNEMIFEINNSGLGNKIYEKLLPAGSDLIPYFIDHLNKIFELLNSK